MVQIIEFCKVGSDDNSTYRFAGRKAWFKNFGEWYEHSAATVGISVNQKVVVIGWENGFVKGAKPWVEQEIWEHIKKFTGITDDIHYDADDEKESE